MISRILLLAAISLAAPAAEVRVGVFGLFRPTSIQLSTSQVNIGGERLRLNAPALLHAEHNQVVFRHLRGPRLTSDGPSLRLTIPGKIDRLYSGSMEITARDGVLIPAIRIDLETAVAIVTASEMPAAPPEARKAQVIAARSYYRAGPRHREFDFCDTTHCQLLRDTSAKPSSTSPRDVLVHNGRILRALYFRSCGGNTLDAAAVGLPHDGYPFHSVECPVCKRQPEEWETRLPLPDIERTENARLQLARRFGWNRVPSNDFTIEPHPGGVLLRGKGHGHGVGLCQRGAAGMANDGLDALSILIHYFPGTTLAR